MAGGSTSVRVDKANFVDVSGFDVADIKSDAERGKNRSGWRLERSVIKVLLERIVSASPTQSRVENFNPDKYGEDRELMESIAANGVLEPIMLKRISALGEDAEYQLVFGQRRLSAARKAGLSDIPAIIARDEDDVDLLTLVENVGRRELTGFERALSLEELKKRGVGSSARELAGKTGLHYTHVADLIKAYSESPPALRGLFATGVSARAIVELQPVFVKLPEDNQAKLAKRLEGVTKRKAMQISKMVNEGASPLVAANSVMADAKEQRPSTKKPKQEAIIPDPEDVTEFKRIAGYTGAKLDEVQRLAKEARAKKASLDELRFACAYRGNGGRAKNPISLAMQASQNKRISRLLKRQLDLREQAQRLMDNLDQREQYDFLGTILYRV
jgi:ParB family chromosome partitioning protein